jgi:hypothetical protein
MRLMVGSVLLCLAFPCWTPAIRLSNFDETAEQDDKTVGYTDLTQASTTSGWSDLYSGMIADGPANSVTDGFPSYREHLVPSSSLFDRNSFGPPHTFMNRDEPSSVIGVTAVVFFIGALRLYFRSAAFRKFYFDTFSPLSPLGY